MEEGNTPSAEPAAAPGTCLEIDPPKETPAWAKTEAERKEAVETQAKKKKKGDRPFKWPCCECRTWTRQRCSRCAIALCKSCGEKFHRPPCEPPPVGEAFSNRFGGIFGISWEGVTMSGQALPLYGEDDEFAWDEILFPFPGPLPGDVAGFYPLEKLIAKEPKFGERNSDLLKPTWHYVVPRSQFASALAMLSEKQTDAWGALATKAHKQVYKVEDDTLAALDKLLDKAFVAGLVKHLRDKQRYHCIVRDDGKAPETIKELVRVLSQNASNTNATVPIYGLRRLHEFYSCLKDCGAPDPALELVQKMHKHYNPGARRLSDKQDE